MKRKERLGCAGGEEFTARESGWQQTAKVVKGPWRLANRGDERRDERCSQHTLLSHGSKADGPPRKARKFPYNGPTSTTWPASIQSSA